MIQVTEIFIKVLARIERIRYVLDHHKGRMNNHYLKAAMIDLNVINDLITDILLKFMNPMEIDKAVREEVTRYDHIRSG